MAKGQRGNVVEDVLEISVDYCSLFKTASGKNHEALYHLNIKTNRS
jgi:hypothetical protein